MKELFEYREKMIARLGQAAQEFCDAEGDVVRHAVRDVVGFRPIDPRVVRPGRCVAGWLGHAIHIHRNGLPTKHGRGLRARMPHATIGCRPAAC